MRARSIAIKARLLYDYFLNFVRWHRNRWSSPAASQVKRSVLWRYGSTATTWIETGTYLGQTTKYLARNGCRVYSIEPEPQLAASAERRFRDSPHITILSGTSEDVLQGLVEKVSGQVAFWLDGHYSSGITFRGNQETPIRFELETIAGLISRFDSVTVFVDDFRCFGSQHLEVGPYPSRSYLVSWADKLGFSWTVEHDIFIAWNWRG